MNNRHCIMLLCALMIQLHLVAQESVPQISNSISYTPVSPQAAAFIKYGDTPVDYSSGLPTIAIPIFDLPIRGYTLPINLSYHAGGIRVDEIASNVGLGWVLNTGGVISHKVISLSDSIKPVLELPPGFDISFLPGYSTPGACDATGYGWMVSHFQRASETAGYCSSAGYMDLDPNFEPDQFTYNINGRSGEITLTKDGWFVPIPSYNTTKFEYVDNVGFVVTDDDGVYYEFFASENVEANSFSFYMSKIVSPEGDSIQFYYDTENYIFIEQRIEYQMFVDNIYHSQDNRCTPPSDFRPIEYKSHAVTGKRLRKIISSNGYQVDFSYDSTDRLDLPGTKKLNEIDVSYKSMGDSTHLFNYKFNQSYMFSGDATYAASLNYRLLLQSVTKNGEPPHSFTYIEGMPSRCSSRQDLWGFTNNNLSNSSIPSQPKHLYFMADRSCDADLMLAGSLEKITYPTGGSTKYIMEPNKYFFIVGETIGKDSVLLSANANQTQNLNFVIPDSVNGPVKVVFDLAVDTQAGITGDGVNYFVPVEETGWSGTDEAYLTPGTYTLTIMSGLSGNSSVKLWWHTYEEDTVNQERIVGGLRVKEIVNFDENLNEVGKRKFSYAGAYAEKILTSKNFYESKAHRPVQIVECHFYEVECMYFTAQNTEVSYEPRSLRTAISYKYVSEEQSSTEAVNGRVDYHFSTVEDIIQGPYDIDAKRATTGLLLEVTTNKSVDNSFEVVNKKVTEYEITPMSSFEYVRGYKFFMLKPEVYDPCVTCLCDVPSTGPPSVIYPGEFMVQTYEPLSHWVRKVNEKNFSYESGDTLLQLTEYGYDGQKFINHIATKTYSDTLFNNINWMTHRGRAIERPSSNAKGIVKNNVEVPSTFTQIHYSSTNKRLRIDSISNFTHFIGDTIIKYKGGFPIVQFLKSHERRVVVQKFDQNNNVTQLVDQSGVTKSLIWGYGKNFVVAEISGAVIEDIAYTSFENQEDKGGWSFSYTANSNAKTGVLSQTLSGSITKSDLNSAQVYEVLFWAYSGGNSSVNGQSTDLIQVVGNWELRRKIISGTTQVTVSGTGAIDELRLHPIGAVMQTYTYLPGIGLKDVTNSSLQSTYYEYDSILHRLENIYDNAGNLINNYKYNYLNQN